MPRIELRKTPKLNPDSTYLARHANQVTSQFGEDGVIDMIFDLITTHNKYCVEFGAFDGRLMSNTWLLLNMSGWSGLLMEGDGENYKELEENYAANPQVSTLNHMVGEGENSLDNILAGAGAPKDLDLMSIDIDGNDFHVWQGMQDFRPRLVVIEFNPTVPNDVFFVQDPEPETAQGASLLAMIELAGEKGYELACVLGTNAFFVLADDFPRLEITDNSIDAMFDPMGMETKFFQGYDGTLFIAGCDRLVWKDVPIDHEALQVLPKEEKI